MRGKEGERGGEKGVDGGVRRGGGGGGWGFFVNDTATTEIYTLSLHDALPIWDLRDTEVQLDFEAPYEDNRAAIRRFIGQARARGQIGRAHV